MWQLNRHSLRKNYDRCSSCASFLSNTDETQSQASQFNFWGQIISKRLPTMIFKFWNIKPISICLSAFLNLSNLCFFARCAGGMYFKICNQHSKSFFHKFERWLCRASLHFYSEVLPQNENENIPKFKLTVCPSLRVPSSIVYSKLRPSEDT